MANTSRNFEHSPRRTLWIILGVCLLCAVGPFTYEFFPRYIVFLLPLPSDDYGTSQWFFQSHATWRNYSDRYFVWRAEATLVYEGIPDDSSRQSIINYFDNEFLDYGWTRSEGISASCSDIMPETRFLKYMENVSENGYIWYHKKGYEQINYGESNESVCLAIWNDSPGVFSVVILTAKPSPFTLFFDVFEL